MILIDKREGLARTRILSEEDLKELVKEAEKKATEDKVPAIAFSKQKTVSSSYGRKAFGDHAAALAVPGRKTIVWVVRDTINTSPGGLGTMGEEATSVRIFGEVARKFTRRGGIGTEEFAIMLAVESGYQNQSGGL